MIDLRGIVVRWGGDRPAALDGVDLAVARGEFVVLVGGNGSGKSTLARVVAGLLAAHAGARRVVDGVHIGLVLQDPSAQLLAPTVERDLAYGLESRCVSPPTMVVRVADLLRRMRLEQLAWRDPHRLSGGQQQRVALAGVLAMHPDLLVLDEPTSQLDAPERARLRVLVGDAHARGLTVLWVTQDPDEFAMATRVVALRTGRVAFDGSARELVDDLDTLDALGIAQPASARLARLVLAHAGDLPGPGDVPLTDDELVARLTRVRA